MNHSIVRRLFRRLSAVSIGARIRAGVLLALTACCSLAQLGPQCPPVCVYPDVSVLTHHNDNTRSGAQLNESILSPQSIRARQLAVTSSSGNTMKGVVNAQPLYVQGVPFHLPFGSFSLDLVYVVDSTNTVYSFIPGQNSGQMGTIEVRSLEPPDETEMSGQRGILSTPAIDKARNVMYVVARAADTAAAPPPYTGKPNAKFILHVLDLRTLADVFPPTTISASVQVPGGTATFVPIVERQRTALLLNQVGGRSYLSFGFGGMPGALGEGQARQHGWALTYDVTDAPVLTKAYASSRYPDDVTLDPNLGIAGIWQGGAGFAADRFGNVFLATANGIDDAAGNHDGDSIVRLTSDGARVWRAPAPNEATLEEYDRDLGGGGPIVLPHDSGASRVFVIGKDGSAILVRAYDTNPSVIQSFQAVQNPAADHVFYDVFWGSPVYWNSHVYYVGSGDYLKGLRWDPSSGAFSLATLTNISQNPEPPDEDANGSNISCGHRSLSLSANGTSGAVLWLARSGGVSQKGNDCPGELDAYDPTTPGSPPLFQWSAGPGVYLARFPMATVAAGHVFLIIVQGDTAGGIGPSALLEFSLR